MMFPKKKWSKKKNPNWPIDETTKKKTKYHSKTQKCSLGHIHHSTGECGYCNNLLLQTKCTPRLVKSFKTQVKYSLKVNGKQITNHFVDFEVIRPDGKLEIHEYKGFATAVWAIKRKLFEALYPDIPYLVIPHQPKGRIRIR